MNLKLAKKAILLFMSLTLISVVGFAQSDVRKEAAKKAASELTDSMTKTLGLTDEQVESVTQYNVSYALSLFTTVPLTDEIITEIDKTLDANLKEVLGDEQYEAWQENKSTWLDSVKSKIPKEDLDVLEDANLDLLK